MTKGRTKMQRVLLGCASVLVFGCLITTAVLIWQWRNIAPVVALFQAVLEEPEYAQGLDTPEAVRTYLQDNSDDVAVLVATVQADGTLDFEDGVAHRIDALMPLGSTKKVVVLAAYAAAVAAGEIDANTAVALAEWDRYHVPGINGGAHIAALSELGFEVDENGYALDGAQTVTLAQMAQMMIQVSDNAASDYFITLLGQERLTAVQQAAGATEPQPILTHAGMALTWHNHEQPRLTQARLDELLAMPRDEYVALTVAMHEKYLNEAWGETDRAWWQGQPPQNDIRLELAAANALDTKGSARVYAQMMGGVATDSFISEEVSAIMQPILQWPMTIPGNEERFELIGAKGGSLAGVLTEVIYLVPQAGDFAGETRVTALFMAEMPVSAWLTMTANGSFSQLEAEMGTNETFVQGLALE